MKEILLLIFKDAVVNTFRRLVARSGKDHRPTKAKPRTPRERRPRSVSPDRE